MLQPGTEVDRYEVVRVLGVGGMATVYLVRHRMLGGLHALKVLNLHHRSLMERLWLEGRAQARLRHPNLVAVTDVVEVGGMPGLVLEFVPDGTLEDLLRRQPMDLEAGLRLFDGILAGVEAAHTAGLVHRDLKPANILLDRSSGTLVPKVADFGLVKVLEDGSPGSSSPKITPLTRAGGAMGTPAYSAPEQIRDARDVDARADVFALGCILYELVCGQQTFSGADVYSTQESVVHGRYTPPEALVPELDRRVVWTIHRCLAADRARRPADCSEVRALLEGRVLGEELPFEAEGASWSLGVAPAANITLDATPAGLGMLVGGTAVPAASAVGEGASGAETLLREHLAEGRASDEGGSGGRGSEDSRPRRRWAGAFASVWAAGLLFVVVGGVYGVRQMGAVSTSEALGTAPAPAVVAAGTVDAGEPDLGAAIQADAPPPPEAPPPPPTSAAAASAVGSGAGGGASTVVVAARKPTAERVAPTVVSVGPTGAASTSVPAASQADPAPARIAVVVTSRPYATITVDGQSLRAGATLAAGTHTVRWVCQAESCAGQTHTETVTLSGNGSASGSANGSAGGSANGSAAYCWDFGLGAWCRGGGG